MLVEEYQYDGIFWASLSEDQRRAIQNACKEKTINIQITPSSLELQYIGRDSQRWVVSLLKQLALIIKEAEGEITCEFCEAEGGSDPIFEFYFIENSSLYFQRGKVVRGKIIPVF